MRGNHDINNPWWFFERPQEISGRLEEIVPGLFVAGVGWHGHTCSDLPGEGGLRPICEGLRRLIMRRLTSSARLIIVSHYPAVMAGHVGLPGERHGSRCLGELLVETRPLSHR